MGWLMPTINNSLNQKQSDDTECASDAVPTADTKKSASKPKEETSTAPEAVMQAHLSGDDRHFF
jgi:hypothetical protein